MSDSFCSASRDGEILIVTLRNPSRMNALRPEMHSALTGIWNDFFEDDGLRVAILTGEGDKAFCAGSDLSAGIDAYVGGKKPYSEEYGYGGLAHRTSNKKPIIAAVNGLALGGGFEVMLCCDLAVASENAEFGLPEPLVGAAATGGGIPRLCRKLPFTVAMTLLMTADRLSAAEALKWGLVTEVTPRGGALEAAQRLARRILRCAPIAIESTKVIADRVLCGDDLGELVRYGQGAPTEAVLNSADAQEGIAAFLEKREPVWSGR